MPNPTDLARGRRLALVHQSNRRAAARHFSTVRPSMPVLVEQGVADIPENYLLH